MEIQSQTTAASVSTGGAAGAAAAAPSNGIANGAQGQGGFSAMFNVMMSGSPVQDTAGAINGLAGIPALIQLLTPLISAVPASDEQASALMAEQIDALTHQLEQTELDGTLLSNPDLQAWLMQLQTLLAAMLPTSSTPATDQGANDTAPANTAAESGEEGTNTVLSPVLFVPIRSAEQTETDNNTLTVNTPQEPMAAEAANSTQSQLSFVPIQGALQMQTDDNTLAVSRPQEPVITQGQAIQMMKQLKELIQTVQNDPELKQILKELPAVLVSAAAESAQIHKPTAVVQRLLHVLTQHAASSDTSTADVADLVQVVPNKVQTLEILAAKSVQPKLSMEMQLQNDEPLFEPLTQTDLSEFSSQPITVQEFMKQVQTGHPVKMPVLHMPAAAFSDDMAQFVVTSFMMESSVEGFTEAKISLYPQHLGQVDVKLTMHHGQLVAQFVAESLAGKEMLESQLSQLRTTLQNHGIQVEKLEVSQSQGFESGMFQDGRQQQSGQSSKQQKSASGRVEAMDDAVSEDVDAAMAQTSENNSIDITA